MHHCRFCDATVCENNTCVNCEHCSWWAQYRAERAAEEVEEYGEREIGSDPTTWLKQASDNYRTFAKEIDDYQKAHSDIPGADFTAATNAAILQVQALIAIGWELRGINQALNAANIGGEMREIRKRMEEYRTIMDEG